MGWVVNATPRPLYPQERDPVSIVQETGWAGLEGCGKLAPTWIRSPVRSALSESLYRLRFPGPYMYIYVPGVPSDFGNTGDSGNTGWLREHGVPDDSGFRLIPRTRSSRWPWETGFPGDSGNSEFRVTARSLSSGWLRKPGLPCGPGTRISGWLRESEVLGDSGNPEFRWLREPGFRGKSGNRCSGWLRESGCFREPGVPGDSGFRLTPRTRIDSANPEFWVTPNSRNSVWPREPGILDICEFRLHREPRFPVSPDPEF